MPQRRRRRYTSRRHRLEEVFLSSRGKRRRADEHTGVSPFRLWRHSDLLRLEPNGRPPVLAESRAKIQSSPERGAGRWQLRGDESRRHDLAMEWDFDGEEFDEEPRLRAGDTHEWNCLVPVSGDCNEGARLVGHTEQV